MWLSGRVLASHIRGPEFQPQHCQKWINIVHETLSWKTLCKKGLEEWLKVQALSSNPITAHTQKKPINEQINVIQCEQSWSDLRKTLKLSCWQWADWSQRPHILSRKDCTQILFSQSQLLPRWQERDPTALESPESIPRQRAPHGRWLHAGVLVLPCLVFSAHCQCLSLLKGLF
jgi:hypothetical protein